MNHSIYSADRPTHMKIVVAALVAGVGVAGFGIAARVNTGNEYSQTAQIIKTKARLEDRRLATCVTDAMNRWLALLHTSTSCRQHRFQLNQVPAAHLDVDQLLRSLAG